MRRLLSRDIGPPDSCAGPFLGVVQKYEFLEKYSPLPRPPQKQAVARVWHAPLVRGRTPVVRTAPAKAGAAAQLPYFTYNRDVRPVVPQLSSGQDVIQSPNDFFGRDLIFDRRG